MSDKMIDPGVWDIIVDTCRMEGLKDMRRDYEYRGSFGQTCVAVVGDDWADMMIFMVNVVEQLDKDAERQKRWLITMISSMRTDGMGKSTIYYFPGWTVSDG